MVGWIHSLRVHPSDSTFLQLWVSYIFDPSAPFTNHTLSQARRSGAVVATDKKMAAGGNKAHQGMCSTCFTTLAETWQLPQGTDHQRIAKLDRENEVAPPAKILPSVGRVRVWTPLASHIFELNPFQGYPNCSHGTQIVPKRRRSKDQWEAIYLARLWIQQSHPQSSNSRQAGTGSRSETPR